VGAALLRKFAAATGKSVTGITDEAREKLADYHWPGNVRELANVIERAVVLGSNATVSQEDLPSRIVASEPLVVAEYLGYREGMNVARKELVRRALSKTQGNRSAAAKVLGLEA
jgi:transcriptional regulator with PAS, ATPase and Fis domain